MNFDELNFIKGSMSKIFLYFKSKMIMQTKILSCEIEDALDLLTGYDLEYPLHAKYEMY